MARKILATMMVLLGVSAAAAYLLYAPTNMTLSIMDPPPEPYDSSVQAIYVTFTKVEIHAADAGNNSGWYTLAPGTTVNLLSVINTPKILSNTPLPPGKYTEIRFFANEVTVAVNGSNTTDTITNGGQTGIKVAITGGGFRIFGGERLNVILDLAFRNSEIMNNPTKTLTPVATARVVY
jgi:hypothetical protein